MQYCTCPQDAPHHTPAVLRSAALIAVVAGAWAPAGARALDVPEGARAEAAVDDGEPGGTAGRPMLEVLRHQQLDGVLATVVRYFGGVKLGAGGLVRAYADTVAQALREAQRVPLRPMQRLAFAVPYELEGVVRREAATAGATLLAVKHGSLVEFELELAQDAAASFAALVDERSSGRVAWQLR